MTLRLVDSAVARVALHRSARNRGYKLERERESGSQVSFEEWCVYVVVSPSFFYMWPLPPLL
jgi:hypothetical protein